MFAPPEAATMRRNTARFPATLACTVLALTTLAAPQAASAQVRDEGRFFTPEAVSRANQTIDRIKRERGKSVVVETYDAIPQNLQGDFRRLGKDPFYVQWVTDRVRSQNLDGVL